MAKEKIIIGRQQQKYDTEERWVEAGEKGFIPKAGEIIVYSDLNKIKIGDGNTNINNLEFSGGGEGGGGTSVQSDWKESSTSSLAFIKNKPSINPGAGSKSVVMGDGQANGKYSFAGGTTDSSVIKDITGADLNALTDDLIVEALGERGIRLKDNLNESPEPTTTGAGSITHGTGTNSITAMSNTYGVGTEAGSKGFYIHKITVPSSGNITISLTTEQKPYFKYTVPIVGTVERNKTATWNDNAAKTALSSLSNGDKVNIILKKIFCLCESIVSIDSDKGIITVTNTGGITAQDVDEVTSYDSLVTAESAMLVLTPYQFSIAVPAKPNVGTVELHFAATATGLGSIAAGTLSQAHGSMNLAAGQYSFAVGQNNATGYGGFASGQENIAIGYNSHAEGRGNMASGSTSHVEGSGNTSSGIYSHAEGSGTTASNTASHAEGRGTAASGKSSHAEGQSSTASGEDSHTEGRACVSDGTASHAEGYGTQALDTGSHSEGRQTVASASYSHAEGGCTSSDTPWKYSDAVTIEGSRAGASMSHAEGRQTYAKGMSSHTEGWGTVAEAANQHVQGRWNEIDTDKKYVHIVGWGTAHDDRKNIHTIDTDGNAEFKGHVLVKSLLVGEKDQPVFEVNDLGSTYMQENLTVEGSISAYGTLEVHKGIHVKNSNIVLDKGYYLQTPTIGDGSTTIEVANIATNSNVDSKITNATKNLVGKKTTGEIFNDYTNNIADALHSHAEGYKTEAHANHSHVQGGSTKTYGYYSHAEGQSTRTGDNTLTSVNTNSPGKGSHAEGYATVAYGTYQHVQGKYNIIDTDITEYNSEGKPTTYGKYAHIVGNGTSGSKRSNAHTLDWNGNAWFKGEIKIGGTGQDDPTALRVLTTEDLKSIPTGGGFKLISEDLEHNTIYLGNREVIESGNLEGGAKLDMGFGGSIMTGELRLDRGIRSEYGWAIDSNFDARDADMEIMGIKGLTAEYYTSDEFPEHKTYFSISTKEEYSEENEESTYINRMYLDGDAEITGNLKVGEIEGYATTELLEEKTKDCVTKQQLETGEVSIIDDEIIGNRSWSSKKIVDSYNPGFEETDSVVYCEALENYPLEIITEIEDSGFQWNEIVLTQCGKNLFDFKQPVSLISYKNSSGQTGQRYGHAIYLSKGTYTISAKEIVSCDVKYIYCVINSKTGEYKNAFNVRNNTTFVNHTFDIDSGDVLFVYNGNATNTLNGTEAKANEMFEKHEVQIEKGSFATEYELYEGKTLKLDISSYSVYGGKYNWTKGILVNDSAPDTSIEMAPNIINGNKNLNYFYSNCGKTTVKGVIEGIVDDSKASNDPWSSNNIIDKLCSSFTSSGDWAYCNPVETSKLTIETKFRPIQPENYAPSLENRQKYLTRSGGNLYHGSKNIVDLKSDVEIRQLNWTNPDGTEVTKYKGFSFTLEPGTYTISCEYAAAESLYIAYVVVDKDGIKKTSKQIVWDKIQTPAPVTIEEGDVIYLYNGSTGDTIAYNKKIYQQYINIMVEQGETASPYVPYCGNNFHVEFGQNVYGGTYNWTTGVLSIDVIERVLDGSSDEYWKYETATNGHQLYRTYFSEISGDVHPLRCDCLPTNNGPWYGDKTGIRSNGTYIELFFLEYSTQEEYQSFLETYKPVVIYGLKSPIQVQLTPQEFAAVSGVNVCHSNMGETTVKGKEHIDSVIERLTNAIIALGGNV